VATLRCHCHQVVKSGARVQMAKAKMMKVLRTPVVPSSHRHHPIAPYVVVDVERTSKVQTALQGSGLALEGLGWPSGWCGAHGAPLCINDGGRMARGLKIINKEYA